MEVFGYKRERWNINIFKIINMGIMLYIPSVKGLAIFGLQFVHSTIVSLDLGWGTRKYI